jgi:hypothetical protein
MRRVVVSVFLTLDGVMQAPGDPDEDREAGSVTADGSGPPSTTRQRRPSPRGGGGVGFLLGRKTDEMLAALWPTGWPTHPSSPR